MIQLFYLIWNLKSSKREYHSYLWMSTLVALMAKSQKGLWSSRGTPQKNLLKSFASVTTSMKRLKRDQSSSSSSRSLLSLLRSRKKMIERAATTTLLAKITTITTKKKMMSSRLILPWKASKRRSLQRELSSIAATQIINFLNYNFTPTTTTSMTAISEKRVK